MVVRIRRQEDVMTTELTYLFLTSLFLTLAWIPHIVGQVMVQGLLTPNDYTNLREQSDFPAWVRRANRAHVNLVEQFAAFAALVLIAHVLEISTSTTAMAAAVYFWSRVAHFVVFIAGVTVLMARTVIFSVSWVAILVLAAAVWSGTA